MSGESPLRLKDLIKKFKENTNVTHTSPISLTAMSGSGFDFIKELRRGDFKKVYDALKADIKSLKEGYALSTQFYNEQKSEKRFGHHMGKYKIGDAKFEIIKVFENKEEMDNDVITPNRFGGILSAAFLHHYNEAKDIPGKLEALNSIVNPFGMLHGFKPQGEIGNDPDKRLLLLIYGITTIGFDFITPQLPSHTLAIAGWRLKGDHPEKLKLNKDGAGEKEVNERAIQGIYTKIVKEGKKLDELSRDDPIFVEAKRIAKVLEKIASEPSSQRSERKDKVVSLAKDLFA